MEKVNKCKWIFKRKNKQEQLLIFLRKKIVKVKDICGVWLINLRFDNLLDLQ